MKLEKGIIKGGKFSRMDVVGIKFGNYYLFETTGPDHWNKYTIQIPRDNLVTAVVGDYDDSLSWHEKNYDLYVDWGVGEPITAAPGTKTAKVTYNTYGIATAYVTYTIKTTGKLQIYALDSTLPGDYVKDIASVRVDYVTGASLFEYYSGFKTIREPVLERLNTKVFTNMSYMFSGCSSMEKINLASFNTSNVTTMYGMFTGCSSLTYLDLSNWDTSKVTSISGFLEGCNSLYELRLDNCSKDTIEKIITSPHFPTNKIIGQTKTIYCKDFGLTEPTNWIFNHNVNEVPEPEEPEIPVIPPEEIPVYVEGQFEGKTELETAITMVTSKHSSLRNMFNGCIKLTSVTSANWDTSNVSDMERMFYDCRSLKSLDLSSCRPVITGTYGCDMFANCTSLEVLDIRNFKIDYYDSEDGYVVKNMFKNCNSLHTLYLNNCNTYTLKQILYEVPIRSTGITGIIYLKQANLRDEGKEIYLNGSCPAGWKFEYVD